MRFFAVAALFAGVLAMPTAETEARTDHNGGRGGSDYHPCRNGLYSNPVCGALGALGVACIDTYTPPKTPKNDQDFVDICAAGGQQAFCAVIPILGQSLLCKEVRA
ncbi:hypothetical protein MY10362_008455 [Beauveria mimosiformis]